jgi:hypothetical protein
MLYSGEAAFARMLQSGPINRLYDKLGFPIPEAEVASWQITDERTGKLVDVPRPVHSLRVWNADTDSYREISAIMDGAPSDSELDAFWAHRLHEVRTKHGDEYVDHLLSRK